MKRNVLIIIFICVLVLKVNAQALQDSGVVMGAKILLQYIHQINSKIEKYNNRIINQSQKTFSKLSRSEDKIRALLQKLNPDTAQGLFRNNQTAFTSLLQKIKTNKLEAERFVTATIAGEFNPYLDSLSSALTFLNKGKNVISQSKEIQNKINDAVSKVSLLQNKLHQSEKIKQYLAERKYQIKQLLSKDTKIPKPLQKQYEKLNKTIYYYSAQIKEYKDLLKDPQKSEQKVLGLLNQLPAFQKFMKENSLLALMLRMPGSYKPVSSQEGALAGLQSRASVQALIQQQISTGGPNAQAQIQQTLTQAHTEIEKLKDKINKLGGGSSKLEMPDFKPNNQKVKTFLQRLEYGTNVQFAKSNNLLPATTDIGVSIGYKLNEKSIIGIAVTYKMGLGTIRHISITHQGFGLRSFVDYKIKKQFFVSGGFEMNYNAQFKNIDQLKSYNAWQQSRLIGLSKKYKISKKVKSEMQLLYDFLANEHRPVTQPVVFRLGYNL